MISVAPSLLAADFSCLGAELRRVASADMLHIDIMDGCFVPNLSMGPCVPAALRDKTSLPFDVHLMLLHPMAYVDAFRKAGVDTISFHIESEDDPAAVIAAIKKGGAKPAVAIKPGTAPETLSGLEGLEMVTVMTVEPGFGGQKLIPQCLDKIGIIKKLLPGVPVEVDGGVNEETAGACIAAGADILVAGTAVFKAADPAAAIARLKTSR